MSEGVRLSEAGSNEARNDGCTSMGLQAWLDVMRFCTRSNDAQANGFVMLQLKVKNGLDDRLSHR